MANFVALPIDSLDKVKLFVNSLKAAKIFWLEDILSNFVPQQKMPQRRLSKDLQGRIKDGYLVEIQFDNEHGITNWGVRTKYILFQ